MHCCILEYSSLGVRIVKRFIAASFMHVVPIYCSLMVRIDALFGLHGFATPKKNGQSILDLPLFSREQNHFLNLRGLSLTIGGVLFIL